MTQARDMVAEIETLGEKLAEAKASINRRFIGQQRVVDLTLTALLCGGHGLLIGLPGLGKTRLVETLSTVMGLDGNRVQFTPDLMPADILGSEVLDTAADGTRAFRFVEGPIFCQLLMADEINRASPRTQSALLQAMQEKTVTVAGQDRALGHPFHVLATQNPIEQEGTYPLPEAQLDRFLMHVRVDYPNAEAEREILKLARREASSGEAVDQPEVSEAVIFAAREEVLKLHMSDAVEEYIVQLIMATRQPEAYDKELASWIEYGASPRATIGLDRCARAHAWLLGRDFVSPDDVKAMAYDVLRHRLVVSYDGEIAGVTADDVIDKLLDLVPVA
jgi:MoxR-like ATPase